jgi:hypothetical protein
MDPVKRGRIMASVRSVSKLELRAKAMAESLAGCRVRQAGPWVVGGREAADGSRMGVCGARGKPGFALWAD